MQTYKHYTVRMPSYALCYLVNGDDSGLESQDKTIIDTHMGRYYREAESVSGSLIIAPQDSEEYFTWSPLFGLACNVVDTDILILV